MHVFGNPRIQIQNPIQYSIHLFILHFRNQFTLASEARLLMSF